MKLDPLTILLEGGGRAFGAGVAGFTLGSIAGSMLAARQLIPRIGLLGGIPIGILFAVGALGYEIAHYRHFRYELTADSLDLESGVFFRREREIPLARIQNVDISRDVLARVLGVATVAIETAGGGQTEARLRYVAEAEAKRLQAEIQRRKRAEQTTDTDAEPAEASLLFELDDSDLVVLSVLSLDPRLFSVLFVFLPMLGPNLGISFDSASGVALLGVTIVGAFASAVGLWALSAGATFIRFYGFRLSRVEDELRYERGLIQRYDGSIPLSKVQTLSIDENVLMRRFGYASLSVETAGYAPGSTPAGGSEAAIPLAHREQLLELAADIEPFEMPDLQHPPKRARRRYTIRYGLVVAVLVALAYAISATLVSYPWWIVAGSFLVVPVAADRKWRHKGWALGEEYAFARNGFWRRRTNVVPDFRVQTVIERQTVFQRRWSLGSVVIDTASSRSLTDQDAVAVDLDAADALSLREAIRDRLQDALTSRRASAAGD
ncbi:MAG: PH domain-containing protein [Halanaeroarchaeum sp.]